MRSVVICCMYTCILCFNHISLVFRSNKTRKNRQFREQVRNHDSAPSSQKSLPDTPIVTKEDVLEAVVKLQLYSNCVVRLIEKLTELPDVIVCYTRAIADIPYKKESIFSFHTEQGYGPSKKVGYFNMSGIFTILHRLHNVHAHTVEPTTHTQTPGDLVAFMLIESENPSFGYIYRYMHG